MKKSVSFDLGLSTGKRRSDCGFSRLNRRTPVLEGEFWETAAAWATGPGSEGKAIAALHIRGSAVWGGGLAMATHQLPVAAKALQTVQVKFK